MTSLPDFETRRALARALVLAAATVLLWTSASGGFGVFGTPLEVNSESSTPEVTSVDPPRASPQSEASLKITGKNFAQGAKVSFSNPGIRVLKTTASTTTKLTVRIQIAADAPTGKTSLFVVNPDGSEAEAPFEVAGGTTKAAAVSEPAARRESGSRSTTWEMSQAFCRATTRSKAH